MFNLVIKMEEGKIYEIVWDNGCFDCKNNCEENIFGLSFLQNISIQELVKIKGIGKVKAIQIKALCELAIRMNRPSDYRKMQIKKPKDIADLFIADFKFLKREIVKVIILNSKNYIDKIVDISLGGANYANVSII